MKADKDRAHCPWQKRETVRKTDGYLIGLCEKHCREPLDIWPDSNSSAERSYSDRLSLTCTHTHHLYLYLSSNLVPSFSTHSLSAPFIFFNRPLYFSLHVCFSSSKFKQNKKLHPSHVSVEKAPGSTQHQ